jgi:hypothetical protein
MGFDDLQIYKYPFNSLSCFNYIYRFYKIIDNMFAMRKVVLVPNLLDKTLSVVVDIRKKREGRLLKTNPDVVRICNAIKGKYDRVRYKAAIWGKSGKFFADILIENENNVFCVVSKLSDMSVSKIKWFWKVLEEVFPNKTIKVIPLEAEAARKSSHSFQQLLLDTIK